MKRRERLRGLLNYYYRAAAEREKVQPTQIPDGVASMSILRAQSGILSPKCVGLAPNQPYNGANM